MGRPQRPQSGRRRGTLDDGLQCLSLLTQRRHVFLMLIFPVLVPLPRPPGHPDDSKKSNPRCTGTDDDSPKPMGQAHGFVFSHRQHLPEHERGAALVCHTAPLLGCSSCRGRLALSYSVFRAPKAPATSPFTKEPLNSPTATDGASFAGWSSGSWKDPLHPGPVNSLVVIKVGSGQFQIPVVRLPSG